MKATASDYRLFIAVELPQAATEALARLQNQLRGAQRVRWVKPAQIHLTLQFLGDVPGAKLDRLIMALQQHLPANPPFELTIEGIGVFPNLKRPRVLWAGVGGETDRLANLHNSTIAATQSLGFVPEDRSFQAHLTLGRTDRQARQGDYQQIGEIMARQQPQVRQVAAFSVEQVSLIRSQLQAGGPLYTTLAEIKLGPG